jgi:cell division protein FtsB
MTAVRNPLILIRRSAWRAAGILVIAYFLGAAILGDNGVLALGDYRRAKAEESARLTALEAERARLAHRSQLLDPRRADPDLAEEMIRQRFGYVRQDELIIEMEPQARPRPAAAAPAPARP